MPRERDPTISRSMGRGLRTAAVEWLVLSRLRTYASFVRFSHSVFALPFALVGVVYASYVAPVTIVKLVLVIVAFTAARFAAMGFNRIVDRATDALNPRTKDREIPAGRLSVAQATGAVVVASAVLVASAALLNPLCLALAPLAAAGLISCDDAVVVAADGCVLATGYSREGSPHDHAEEAAIAKLDPADPRLGAATLYSSLEPCRFRASRPRPSAALIIAAGLRRVVIAWLEPPVFAPGGGAELLRETGIAVVEVPGLAAQARAINAAVLGE